MKKKIIIGIVAFVVVALTGLRAFDRDKLIGTLAPVGLEKIENEFYIKFDVLKVTEGYESDIQVLVGDSGLVPLERASHLYYNKQYVYAFVDEAGVPYMSLGSSGVRLGRIMLWMMLVVFVFFTLYVIDMGEKAKEDKENKVV